MQWKVVEKFCTLHKKLLDDGVKYHCYFEMFKYCSYLVLSLVTRNRGEITFVQLNAIKYNTLLGVMFFFRYICNKIDLGAFEGKNNVYCI